MKLRTITYSSLGFLILCMFQSFAMFQPDSTLNFVSYKGIYLIVSYLIIASTFVLCRKHFTVRIDSILFAISTLSFWLLEYTHSYGGLTLFSSTIYLVIIPFLFLKQNVQEKVYDEFVKVYFWMSLFGIFIFFLYILNILDPFSIADYYEEDMRTSYYANYYIGYLFVTDYGITRLCGLFNEPGFYGTLAILLLVSRRFNFDKFTLAMLVASVLTFSLAFLVLMFIYLAFRAIVYRQIKILILVVPLLSILFYLTTQEFADSNLMFFFERILPEDGNLISDNRSTYDMEQAWSIFKSNSNKLLFGYGPSLNVKGSSYKILLMKHGITGALLIFTPFLIACLRLIKNNKDSLLLVMIFIISIYQRPQVFNLAYFVILIGGLLHLQNRRDGCVE